MHLPVSIIIPTYNRRPFLKQAVNSILDQKFTEFELIVVDSCSDDGTIEFLESIDDDRLQVIFQDEPQGVGSARNIGIKASNGKYLVFLDDDDYFFEDAITVLVETILGESPRCGGVFTGMWIKHGSGQVCDRRTTTGRADRYRDATVGGLSCTLIRRVVIEEIGYFDESLPYSEDTDYWIRLYLAGFYMTGVDQPLYARHSHADQMSTDPHRLLSGWAMLMKKHTSNMPDRWTASRYYAMGRRLVQIGEIREARVSLRRAIRIDPTLKGPWYYYFWLAFGLRGYTIGEWIHTNVYARYF